MVTELRRPLLTPLVQHRLTGVIISGAVSAQIGLTALGLPGWPCPFLHGVGIPCPGCGLSRATAALLQGEWQSALNLHAFAPIFLVAFILVAGAVLLPHHQRNWLISQLELVERRTGITTIVLISFLFYWLARLVVFPEAFINLIKG